MRKYLLMASAAFCLVFLSACSTTKEAEAEKAAVSKKKEKKTKSQQAWIKEMLKRERIRDQSTDHFIGDDYQVFPGRKRRRSSDLDGDFKAFFWE